MAFWRLNYVQINHFPADHPIELQDSTIVGSENSGCGVDANTTAPGALFDTFPIRRTIDGGRVLICGQQKCFKSIEVNSNLIMREVEKISTGLLYSEKLR